MMMVIFMIIIIIMVTRLLFINKLLLKHEFLYEGYKSISWNINIHCAVFSCTLVFTGDNLRKDFFPLA